VNFNQGREQMTVDFCITVLFDQNYVEPALVTAIEILEVKPENVDFYLIYLCRQNDSTDVINLLSAFSANSDRVKLIKLADTALPVFNVYHFTNSIIYKLLIPSIVNAHFILNIDAGTILGKKFPSFLSKTQALCEHAGRNDFVVEAYCDASQDKLPTRLLDAPHNKLYPWGWILLFNKEAYQKINLFDATMTKFKIHQSQLVYAEQDLLCLLLEEGQLIEFDNKDELVCENLTLDGLINDERSEGIGGNYCFYKVAGTLKPWKYWVLDPKKEFYLRRRLRLCAHVEIDSYGIIGVNRHSVNHLALAKAFLEVNDSKILNIHQD
jgi:lipopolysaccharide biosynthesis glycosyltransferase